MSQAEAAPPLTVTQLEEALGVLEAKRLLDDAREGECEINAAPWHRFVLLAAKHGGWRSAACRAFVNELGKRAAEVSA